MLAGRQYAPRTAKPHIVDQIRAALSESERDVLDQWLTTGVPAPWIAEQLAEEGHHVSASSIGIWRRARRP